MKKITLLFLLFTFSLSFGQVVLTEDFEAGLSLPAGWTNNDIEGSGNVWTFDNNPETPAGFTTPNTYMNDPAGLVGNYAIFNSDAYGGGPENAALESPVFDCSSFTSVKLSFNHFYLSGWGGLAYVEVYNGSNWVEVASYDDSVPDGYTLGAVLLDVSTELAGVSNAQVRFRWEGDYSWWWAVDNIVVQQPTVSAPDAVFNPTPADGATDVALVQDDASMPNKVYFSWTEPTTGDPATSYRLVFGDTNPPTMEFNGFTNGDFLYNVSYDTTYYWQIVAINVGGETPSEIWTFTTEAEPTASVDESDISSFKHFYNKDTNILTLTSAGNAFDNITLYSILGQEVMNKTLSKSDEVIDLSNLTNGVYLAKVSIGGKSQTIKLLKQ